MAQIDDLLKLAVERGASDLHLSPGSPALARLNGAIVPLGTEPLARDALQLMLLEIADPGARARFEKTSEADFAYELPGVIRARCSLYEQARGIGGALRLLPLEIPSCHELGLPPEAVDLVDRPFGLVILSGPPGSGRTCTEAALVDALNRTECRHIVTLEAPIEFRHASRKSLVDQREIGRHTPTLAQGLRAALHADADVMAVCEPRTTEAIELALEAASGRLVLLTWTATSAARALGGLLAGFSGEARARVAALIAETLVAVLGHRLVPRADGPGRTLALELLVGTPEVAALVREQRIAELDALREAEMDETLVGDTDARFISLRIGTDDGLSKAA